MGEFLAGFVMQGQCDCHHARQRAQGAHSLAWCHPPVERTLLDLLDPDRYPVHKDSFLANAMPAKLTKPVIITRMKGLIYVLMTNLGHRHA